jgi:hypothetical protein
MSDYRLDDRATAVRSLAEAQVFSSSLCVQTSSESHPASYPTRGPFPGDKVQLEIKKARLRWLGHVERMSENRDTKNLYMSKPEGRRSVGRPKMRWLDDVEEDLKR